MSATIRSKVESSCNNWSCCKEPKLREPKPSHLPSVQVQPPTPKVNLPTVESETEVKVTKIYQRTHKSTGSPPPSIPSSALSTVRND